MQSQSKKHEREAVRIYETHRDDPATLELIVQFAELLAARSRNRRRLLK